MNKNLLLQYYYNEDGSLDLFTELLTCFDAPLYFVLKNKIGNVNNPCEAFLRDITFYLSQNNDESIYDIGFLDNSINSDMFKLKWYGGKGSEALTQVETLLDVGDLVMIQTDTRRVPFFKYYQGSNNMDDGVAVPGHAFLAVHHEKNQLYYVEAPWNLNPENFVAYKDNKSVGVVNKDELKHAFGSFLNCITITLSEEGLLKVDRIRSIIEKSIKNYEKKVLNSDGFSFSYGREAMEKLIDVCKREFLYLNNDVASYSLNLFGLLSWKFWDIVKRRRLMYEYFLKYSKQYSNADIDNLVTTIDNNINIWLHTIEVISKRYSEKKYLMDTYLQKFFTEVANSEEKLNSALKNFISKK